MILKSKTRKTDGSRMKDLEERCGEPRWTIYDFVYYVILRMWGDIMFWAILIS